MSDNLYNDQVKVDGKHGGSKYDGNKAQYSLIPPDSLKAVAEVMTEGAKKYSANNWVGLELTRVLDALERHINDFKSGQDYATDSGQHHMAHAIANAMMAYHIAVNKPGQDDRLFRYVIAESIEPITDADLDEVYLDEEVTPPEGECNCYSCVNGRRDVNTPIEPFLKKVFTIDLGDKTSEEYRTFVAKAKEHFNDVKAKRATMGELGRDIAAKYEQTLRANDNSKLTQSEAVTKAKADVAEDLVSRYAKKYPQKEASKDDALSKQTFLDLWWNKHTSPGNYWS